MIYFDHAATTPVSRPVLEKMIPYLKDKYGNPSSIYRLGREAKQDLDQARQEAANLLGSKDSSEIIFTSGASESNNLAIKGVAIYCNKILGVKPHLLVSRIEHRSVLDAAKYLAKYFDHEVDYLPVDQEGRIKPESVRDYVKENTVFLSIHHGNNESGTLEPIKKIAEMLAEEKKRRKERGSKIPLVFHSDAVQTFQYFDCDVDRLGVDMLSLSAHKFNGPKGAGLLYLRKNVSFLPQTQGGSQEGDRRAGTENLASIIGLVEAMKTADQNKAVNEQIVSKLTDYLVENIQKAIPDCALIGPEDLQKRLPHIATFLFSGLEGESILIKLDQIGIAASSGSACTSGSLEPSHVTKALGYSDIDAHGSVRFSLSPTNTTEEIDYLMKHLPKIIASLRKMSPFKEWEKK